MQNEIMVSISCITYNHEPYIADAIESFLMQKTNFKYEILIHDDASTDKTAEIIKEYENKYPGIIKPIYQNENQYSKGVRVGTLNNSRAIGKYIAMCEGDDYWTDPYKLQIQIDFLENNPEYSLCVHAARRVDAKTKKELSPIRPSKSDRDFSIEEVISNGADLPTNSMVYHRKESLVTPNFYDNAPVGDYPFAIFLSIIGKVHYMDEFMSAYRANVEGSWTSRTSNNVEKFSEYSSQMVSMLTQLDEYTKGKYEGIIEDKKIEYKYSLLVCLGDYKLVKEEYKNVYDSLNFRYRRKIIMRQYFPSIFNKLTSIKRKYKAWALK